MSHTHFLYHIVFATKERLPILEKDWRNEAHAYLGGIVKNFEGVPIEINGVADHVHLLVRLQPKFAFSDFMRELKRVLQSGFGRIIFQNLPGKAVTEHLPSANHRLRKCENIFGIRRRITGNLI